MRNRNLSPRRSSALHGAMIAMLTGALALPLQPAEVIYEETFNTDGDGIRYTMTGRASIENVDGQIGPGFWDLSSNVSFVGIPNAAPARRAMLLWHHEISPEAMASDALELFDSTVAWLTGGKANAAILYTSAEDPANGDSVLLERLADQGHVVQFDNPDLPVPDPSTINLILKSSGSGNSSPNRFTLYPVPMLSYSGVDHDDTLLSSIGRTKTFNPGQVVIEEPDHPAAGGKTSPVEWVTSEQAFSTIGTSLPDDATLVASYRLERLQPITSLAQVDQMISGALPSRTVTGALAAADASGGEFGVGGNWEVNLQVPGNPIGGFALVGRGQLEVLEAGTYSVAFRVSRGGRLRIDLDRDGLDAQDDVVAADNSGGLFLEDVSFGSIGSYDFEWVAFNSDGGFGSEISLAFTQGGGTRAPVNADSWDLLGSPLEPPPVRLNGEIQATTYILDQEPIVEYRPVLVAIDEGGPLFGGGLITSPDGSDFIGAAALARFADSTGLSASEPYTLTLQPIDVSGKEDVRLSFSIAGTFVDFEPADFLRVTIDKDADGPGGFETLVEFSGDGKGALSDGTTRVVREFQEVTYPVPSDATQVVIRFEAWNTWFNEIVAFDNVRITAGTLEPAPSLSIANVAEGIRLEFTGILQAADAVDGNWTDVEGAGSPHLIEPSAQLRQQFFRVR